MGSDPHHPFVLEFTLSRVINITMRQIVLFRELANVGAFGAAAARLGIGQPSLSRSVRQLEEELGVMLLRRHSKGAVLTEKGNQLKDLVSPFIDALESLPDTETKIESQKKIVLGIPSTLSSLLTPLIFRSLLDQNPELCFGIVEGSSLSLEHAAETGVVDVALLYDPAGTSNLKSRALLDEDMLVIASPSCEWPEQKSSISARDLINLPMVFLKPDQNDRRRLAETERQQGIRLEPIVEVSSPSTIKALVNQGVGLSVASALGVSSEIAAGSLQHRPLGNPTWTTRLWVSTQIEGASSAIINSLIESVADCVVRIAENRPFVKVIRRLGVVLG